MEAKPFVSKNNISLSKDAFFEGKLNILQPEKGFRAGTDAIFLAAFINAKPQQSLAEFGCGVGTVSLALALRVPCLKIKAFEINQEICAIAKENVIANNLHNSVDVINQDVKELVKQTELANSFNIVTSNPPFYKQNSAKPALNNLRAQGFIEESAKLEDFIVSAKFVLCDKGFIYLIHIAERLDELVFLLKKYGFGSIEILGLYSYVNKSANRVIVKARKNTKGFCKLLKPFVIHEGNNFSKQASSILRNCEQLVID